MNFIAQLISFCESKSTKVMEIMSIFFKNVVILYVKYITKAIWREILKDIIPFFFFCFE